MQTLLKIGGLVFSAGLTLSLFTRLFGLTPFGLLMAIAALALFEGGAFGWAHLLPKAREAQRTGDLDLLAGRDADGDAEQERLPGQVLDPRDLGLGEDVRVERVVRAHLVGRLAQEVAHEGRAGVTRVAVRTADGRSVAEFTGYSRTVGGAAVEI